MTVECPHRKTDRLGEQSHPEIEFADGRWHVRSHRLVRTLLRDRPGTQAGFSAELVAARSKAITLPVLYQDGAEHRSTRASIGRYFAPATVDRRYRTLMEQRADDLVAQARTQREVSLDQLSLRMAVHVAAQVIGLTNSPVDEMSKRLERFFAFPAQASSSGPGTRWQQLRTRARSYRTFAALGRFYLHDVRPAIRARRERLGEDVISHLISEGAGNGSIFAECLTYGAAGMVTTREFIIVVWLHLMENPGLRAEYLSADERRRHEILQEILRAEPVVGHILRRAPEDIDLDVDGVTMTIPAGAIIDLYIRPANADPEAVGARGDQICLDRQRAKGVRPEVLSFGDGAHRCPGNHLAIQETDILMTRLLDLDLELISEPTLGWVDVVAGYELRNVRVRVRG